MSRSKLPASKHPAVIPRRCWRVRGLSDIVMFHGRHTEEFIAHSHDDLTAILVTDGAVDITVDERLHRVGKGQLVVIGAHQVHWARPVDDSGWEMRSLHLPPTLLEGGGWHSTKGPVSFATPVRTNPGAAATLFHDLHCCSEHDEPSQLQSELLRTLVHWFVENADAFGPQMPWHAPIDVRLERARHILGNSLFENTTLDAVAEEVGLSIFSLIRQFKDAYGFSPHAWRMQARANEAATLLRRREPLANVAGSCGFADQSHFTRVFKKVYGVTPGQYSLMH